MIHKAWCTIEEVPYCFTRSSIKFQGHTGWKIEDLNPIWVRLLGHSQLWNPSDLPCYCCHVWIFIPLTWTETQNNLDIEFLFSSIVVQVKMRLTLKFLIKSFVVVVFFLFLLPVIMNLMDSPEQDAHRRRENVSVNFPSIDMWYL